MQLASRLVTRLSPLLGERQVLHYEASKYSGWVYYPSSLIILPPARIEALASSSRPPGGSGKPPGGYGRPPRGSGRPPGGSGRPPGASRRPLEGLREPSGGLREPPEGLWMQGKTSGRIIDPPRSDYFRTPPFRKEAYLTDLVKQDCLYLAAKHLDTWSARALRKRTPNPQCACGAPGPAAFGVMGFGVRVRSALAGHVSRVPQALRWPHHASEVSSR